MVNQGKTSKRTTDDGDGEEVKDVIAFGDDAIV
ncbi:MAG: hypothetical protein CM15mV42_0910 [uncultured marine virus]|nr:MAG: hypothetical protein CM15mV42_0910 [uncultured marine virus]